MRNVNGYLDNILLLKRAGYVNSAYRLLKWGSLTYRHKYGGWRSFRFFELERILMNSWLILMRSYFSVQWSPISERTLLCLIDPRLRSSVLTTVVLRRRKLCSTAGMCNRVLRKKKLLQCYFVHQTSHGPNWNRNRSSSMKGRRLTVCHSTAFIGTVSVPVLRLKEDRRSMYNVTLRRVRATIVAVERQQVLHVRSLYL